ncbi:MBOAT family O-acyltransferase [Vibrio sp. PNB22_8_1]|uniref:MBOAT family O-acyltransferase n=1 Tax=unclassified Vibrio TaxID=2614977 RepID=UPI00406A7C77
MLFPTFEFVFAFLPLSLSLYWMTFFYRPTESIRVMLVISLVFYFLPNWLHGHIIIASILVNFVISKYVQKTGKIAKYFLILGIVYNLAVIGYYKYSFFFGEIFYYLTDIDMGLTKFILPVGISFYTFQQIAYLVDCYKEKDVDYSFWHYSLFVTFFPQLIAGPIVHHKELIPQFMRLKNLGFNGEWFAAGAFIFIIGLAKKLLLADNLEVLATEVFSHADKGDYIGTFAAWVGALSYTLQLYFDFSAYSDMAIGLGLMFGIRLPINFLSPYKSESIVEFWRRWHITLSAFLRDYLYIPLGGNRNGAIGRYRNLMLTMLIGGLWHGAGFNFIIWGGLHGFYLIANHAFQSATRNINLSSFKPLFVLVTLFFVVIAWVFFRAETLHGAMTIVYQMLSFSSATSEVIQVQPYMIFLIVVGFFITQFTPNVSQMFEYQGWKTPDDWQPITIFFDKFKFRKGALAYISCLLAASLMFMAQPTVFIYFNF